MPGQWPRTNVDKEQENRNEFEKDRIRSTQCTKERYRPCDAVDRIERNSTAHPEYRMRFGKKRTDYLSVSGSYGGRKGARN